MKVKKALPICLFLSLFVTMQNAHAFGWLRIFSFGSRAASTTARMGSSAAKLSRGTRSTSLMKGLGKEALIAGSVGVVANELYDNYQSDLDAQAPTIENYVAEQNRISTTPKQEAFSRSITIKLGDPDLVW